jgi:hypothetical protein
VPADTTVANLGLIKSWVERFGRPLCLYTDWATHFRLVATAGRQALPTQIQRALEELEIGLICAHSPQAKGRVERSHGTDQDRLVKGLRLAGATTLQTANRFLEQRYLPQINERFAVKPASAADAHRSAAAYDLEAILSVQETRHVANDFTVQVDAVTWQIQRHSALEGLRGATVKIERRLDGTLHLRWGERYLSFHEAPGTPGAKMAAAPAGGGGSSGLRPSSPPPPAYPKSKRVRTPSPQHPWKKRTILLC